MTTNFFSPLSFVAVFGSGIRNPGYGMGKNQDPGSGINIPDPQHWYLGGGNGGGGNPYVLLWRNFCSDPDLNQCYGSGIFIPVPGSRILYRFLGQNFKIRHRF